MGDNSPQETEQRPVRSEDPSLSPRANELLTREVQQAVGAEQVEVPKDAPRHSAERHATHSSMGAALSANRPVLVVTFLVALVLGGIIALVTDQYWTVILALALHAIGTLVVAGAAIHLTTETEHVDPTVAARLEEEGVADPDRVLSELVEDYAGAREARGVSEVVSGGHNERTVAPEDDAARSSTEQRTAMTPSSGGSPAGGSNSAVAALEWWIIGALAVFSVALAALMGGDMWALPAIVVPLCAGWVTLQHWMARGGGQSERASGDGKGATKQLLPVGVFTVVGVIWFMVVVGFIADLL
jgi:hypothetical protein